MKNIRIRNKCCLHFLLAVERNDCDFYERYNVWTCTMYIEHITYWQYAHTDNMYNCTYILRYAKGNLHVCRFIPSIKNTQIHEGNTMFYPKVNNSYTLIKYKWKNCIIFWNQKYMLLKNIWKWFWWGYWRGMRIFCYLFYYECFKRMHV